MLVSHFNGLDQQFSNILNPDSILESERHDSFLEHSSAIGTGGSDHISPGAYGLLDTQFGHLAFGRSMAECTPAPASAAEAVVAIVRHFHQDETRYVSQDTARCFVDTVVASQVTGIMKGDPVFYLEPGLQFSLRDKSIQEHGVVFDFHVDLSLCIGFPKRVKAMRRVGENSFNTPSLKK